MKETPPACESESGVETGEKLALCTSEPEKPSSSTVTGVEPGAIKVEARYEQSSKDVVRVRRSALSGASTGSPPLSLSLMLLLSVGGGGGGGLL